MSITTVFANGGSQAVRIPKEFRFDTDSVSIRAYRGGVLLMPLKRRATAEDFFRVCDAAGLSDFALDRSDNVILQPKDYF